METILFLIQVIATHCRLFRLAFTYSLLFVVFVLFFSPHFIIFCAFYHTIAETQSRFRNNNRNDPSVSLPKRLGTSRFFITQLEDLCFYYFYYYCYFLSFINFTSGNSSCTCLNTLLLGIDVILLLDYTSLGMPKIFLPLQVIFWKLSEREYCQL